MWPWKKTEKRESSFTDTLVAQILSTATGASLALPRSTGALETCSGVLSRAFAAAEIQGPLWVKQALTPQLLALIGRALIREGEVVLAVGADSVDGLSLTPVSDHDVTGVFDPKTWVYRLNLAGPSAMTTRSGVPSQSVIHFMWARDPSRPWRGIGPLESAYLAGRLSAETSKALADESSGPRGSLLPLPHTDGEDATVASLKRDIKSLNGALALVESMSDQWGSGDNRSSPSDWQTKRVGADPPIGLVDLASQATREVLAAVGIPPALFAPSPNGAASREAWRQLLFGVLAPLGRMVSSELSAKLEADVSLDWHELRASDLAGRARAFQSMVGSGMDISKAAALAGLMAPEEP